jgi:hypothetical protein
MKASVVLCLVVSLPMCVNAQQGDTAFIAASESSLQQFYATSIKGDLPIYTGGAYAEYVSLNEEFPYFSSDDWITGSIVYMNDSYTDVPLQYDLSTETLVIEHFSSARKIKLASKRISEFRLADHRFVNLNTADLAGLPESGFYEILEDGEVNLYARRKKNLQKQIVSGKLIASFEEINRYYLLKDSVFHPVKSKTRLLKLLRDKPELKQEMKRSKLKVIDRETTLIAISRLYNSLAQ